MTLCLRLGGGMGPPARATINQGAQSAWGRWVDRGARTLDKSAMSRTPNTLPTQPDSATATCTTRGRTGNAGAGAGSRHEKWSFDKRASSEHVINTTSSTISATPPASILHPALPHGYDYESCPAAPRALTPRDLPVPASTLHPPAPLPRGVYPGAGPLAHFLARVTLPATRLVPLPNDLGHSTADSLMSVMDQSMRNKARPQGRLE
eukprot:scaffold13644_cov117-Isochrysis_galbana.AAC.8